MTEGSGVEFTESSPSLGPAMPALTQVNEFPATYRDPALTTAYAKLPVLAEVTQITDVQVDQCRRVCMAGDYRP